MKHIGLFEGIGGFSLAARWMGWQTVAWCEWNSFCQKVLAYHFPEAEQFNDITKSDFTKYHGTVDIITGGFPCQPYSVAGKQKGKEDERHLWPEMLRVIRQVAPRWVIGENVPGLVSWNDGMVFTEVQTDLEALGYEVIPFNIPAAGVGAPHRRERFWFVAYASNVRCNNRSNNRQERHIQRNIGLTKKDKPKWHRWQRWAGEAGEIRWHRPTENTHTDGWGSEQRQNGVHGLETATNTSGSGRLQNNEKQPPKQLERNIPGWRNFPTQSPVCNGDDGLSARLDAITFPKWRAESIKAGGNAIVPQVALQIFKAIVAFEEQLKQEKAS